MVQTKPITAEETKLSLDVLSNRLQQAASYAYGYSGAPMYVVRKIQYIIRMIYHLERQAQELRDKIPDKFRAEQ